MSSVKSKDLILEAIDQLRRRKARPDLERICHILERKHGLSFDETTSDLERLVDAGVIIKVDYKGSTSYRNAAKCRRSKSVEGVGKTKRIKRALFEALQALCGPSKQADKPAGQGSTIDRQSAKTGEIITADPSKTGATTNDIECWLQQNDPTSSLLQADLESVLRSEVEAGVLDKLADGTFIWAEKNNETPKKEDGESRSPTMSPEGGDELESEIQRDDSQLSGVDGQRDGSKLPQSISGKKTKQPTKGKRMRKSVGSDGEGVSPAKQNRPDSNTSLELTSPVPTVEPAVSADEPRCDFCLQTAISNRQGKTEELLICKDCQAKAHPSCMDYSEELAKRARNSPWQCIDCKTCYICEDAGDPDAMLFCDACDKGYHMTCHDPPVQDKPQGKWMCAWCVSELGEGNLDSESSPTQSTSSIANGSRNSDGGGASCLPTPCESPVNFHDENSASATLDENVVHPLPKLANTLPVIVPDASNWTVQDVVDYFKNVGFITQAEVFREQEIDGKSLLLMKRSDVLTGLSLKLGPALKIFMHIQRLQSRGHLVH